MFVFWSILIFVWEKSLFSEVVSNLTKLSHLGGHFIPLRKFQSRRSQSDLISNSPEWVTSSLFSSFHPAIRRYLVWMPARALRTLSMPCFFLCLEGQAWTSKCWVVALWVSRCCWVPAHERVEQRCL